MKPSVGRIVLYTLSAQDSEAIMASRKAAGTFGNPALEGTVAPAVVLAVWPGNLCNLKVLLDGPDTFWAMSRPQKESVKSPFPVACWDWPVRD